LCQETCVFTSHRVAICVKFDKNTKMCILNRNIDDQDNFFNRGKFVIFTTVNYLNPFFDIRRNYPNVTDLYLLRDTFNASTGIVGHSVFFRKFNIQGAYKPKVEIINKDNLALVLRAIQQQQQQQNPPEEMAD